MLSIDQFEAHYKSRMMDDKSLLFHWNNNLIPSINLDNFLRDPNIQRIRYLESIFLYCRIHNH